MKKYILYQSNEFFFPGNNLVWDVLKSREIRSSIFTASYLILTTWCFGVFFKGSFVFKPQVLFKTLSLLVSVRNFMTLFDKLQ